MHVTFRSLRLCLRSTPSRSGCVCRMPSDASHFTGCSVSPVTFISLRLFWFVMRFVYINLLHSRWCECMFNLLFYTQNTHAIGIYANMSIDGSSDCIAICKQRLIETLLFSVRWTSRHNHAISGSKNVQAITFYALLYSVAAVALMKTHTNYMKHFTFPGICNRSFSTLINWSKNFKWTQHGHRNNNNEFTQNHFPHMHFMCKLKRIINEWSESKNERWKSRRKKCAHTKPNATPNHLFDISYYFIIL